MAGRVRTDATGAGAGFDGTPGVTDISDVTAPTIGQATGYARGYSYDAGGRLTQVRDNTSDGYAETTSVCSVRTYGIDGNGRRTSLQSTTHPDGDCTSTTGTTTTTNNYAYDTADRPTTGANAAGSYVYDTFGRQTTLPAADAPNPTAGNITLGYYHDDLPRTITQNGTTTTFDLDSAGRRLTATTTTGASTDQTLTRHYGDDSDNPTWTATTSSGTTTAERHLEALGGGLGATITTAGETTLPLATLHGDIVTTVSIPATQPLSVAAIAITGWTYYTEYGAPRSTPANHESVTGNTGYGWLGTHQRSATTQNAGLSLMGLRTYNPLRAMFTSPDPLPGGNSSGYTYSDDPVNSFDLTGAATEYFGRTYAAYSNYWYWGPTVKDEYWNVINPMWNVIGHRARYVTYVRKAINSSLVSIGGRWYERKLHFYQYRRYVESWTHYEHKILITVEPWYRNTYLHFSSSWTRVTLVEYVRWWPKPLI
ncbi:MAG: hypothetical protein JNL54_19935 [Kineosporiaceae bacterium]|nr:hypothetical protein [Kineosporiaceae bacterium]